MLLPVGLVDVTWMQRAENLSEAEIGLSGGVELAGEGGTWFAMILSWRSYE